jgi:hypothetical protein
MNGRPTARAALSIAGGLAALLTLTACGGDSAADAAAEAATAAAAPSGAPDITAYRDCLAENGVTLPEMGAPGGERPSDLPSDMPSGGPGAFPGGLPDGVDQEAFDAAQAACADLAPVGGPGGAGGPVAIDESAVAAFRSCLADNGVEVADSQDAFAGLDRGDPTVMAALDTCSPLLPVPTPAESG